MMKYLFRFSLFLLALWPALLSAGITSKIVYPLGEAGSLGMGHLPLDTGGNSRHFTTATGGMSSQVRTEGVWAPGSTAYLSTTGATVEGWSAPNLLNGLATDNFAFGVFVRAPAIETGGRDIMTLGGATGALKLSLGSGGWCASAHNVSWIGQADGVAGSFSSSKWVHLAVIRHSGVSTYYLNGVARGSWGGLPVHGTPFLCLNFSDGLSFHGDVDQARIVTFDAASDDVAVLAELWGAPNLPGDLASNPGFESGMAGWTSYYGGNAQADLSSPHTGNLAARVTARNDSNQGLATSALSSLVPGISHVASAWVRTSSATPVSVNIGTRQEDGAGTGYNYAASSSQVTNVWTKISGVFNYDVSGTASAFSINITGPPAGVDLWVDDVSFAPVDTTAVENLLTNSGFENGTQSWVPHGPTTVAASALSHTKLGAAAVTNRSAAWQGIEQSVLGKTEAGRMYYAAGWVMTDRATPSDVILTMEVNDASGARYFQIANGTATNASWTWLSGTVTMPATTGLTDVKIFLEGPASGVEMRVDDCYFAPVTGLRRAAAAFPALRLGGVGGVGNWAEDPRFRAAISAHFHLSSPENSMKFDSTQPADGVWKFAESNAMNELGIARGGSSRGHVMVWHEQIAGWVPRYGSPATTQTNLWNYIDKTATTFKGRLACWDVVNEAINDGSGTLRSSLWYNSPGIGYAADGDKYIRESFIRARASDPTVPLIYNDYSNETINAKSDAIYNMLSGFVNTGVPVTGVGFQSHLYGTAPDGPSTRANFQRFQDLGLDLQVTELDISLVTDANGRASASDLVKQGDYYFDYLGTALGYSRLKVFQTWGVYDGSSWIPYFVPGRGQALPLDFNFNRKPAYWGMWNAMAGQCEKLNVLAVSNGDYQSVLGNTTLSANAGRQLNADADGDFITLQAHVPFSGQWNVKIGALNQATGGSFQLAIAPPGSTNFTDINVSQDTYAANSESTELNLGTVAFGITGDWQFRFTVTGKNPSATAYHLFLDYIRLTPISCAPAVSGLTDQNIAINSSMPPRLFLAEDDFAEGTLQVTATSSNPALLPSSALTLNGASPYFTLAATPTTEQIGSTTVNVTASDGTQTSSQNFTLNVVGTPLQTWRQQHFNSTTNRGNAADNSDANADGESNFMEFATGQNPHTNNRATPTLVRNGANLEFTYLRSDAALAENVVFIVEWSDDLTAGSWSSTGVNQTILSDNSTTQSVRGSVPASAGSKRFLRLRVVK
jgi:GH35 family endo-1,4-beta-xylanase